MITSRLAPWERRIISFVTSGLKKRGLFQRSEYPNATDLHKRQTWVIAIHCIVLVCNQYEGFCSAYGGSAQAMKIILRSSGGRQGTRSNCLPLRNFISTL